MSVAVVVPGLTPSTLIIPSNFAIFVSAKVSDTTCNSSLQSLGEHKYDAGRLELTSTVISSVVIPVHRTNAPSL